MHIKNCGRDEKDHCVQLNGHSRMRHSVLENGLGKGHFGVLLGPDASAEGNVVYHHLQGTGLKADQRQRFSSWGTSSSSTSVSSPAV